METKNSSEIVSVPVGPLGVNCYLVRPGNRNKLYIIDPGDEPARILNIVRNFDVSFFRILLTHAHVDHISGAGAVAKSLNLNSLTLSPKDLDFYRSPLNNLEPLMPAAENLPDTVWIDKEPSDDFTVIETPGHTEGSVCYYFRDLNAVFTGDTLFAGSVGRTDLPGSGLYEDLIFSIKERLYLLPEKTKVFPGHGKETDIAFEKQFNPFTR